MFTLRRDVLRYGTGTTHCCVLAGTLVSLYSAACEDKEIFAQLLKHGLKVALDFDQAFIACLFTGQNFMSHRIFRNATRKKRKLSCKIVRQVL